MRRSKVMDNGPLAERPFDTSTGSLVPGYIAQEGLKV
jgi:hypothetical protein